MAEGMGVCIGKIISCRKQIISFKLIKFVLKNTKMDVTILREKLHEYINTADKEHLSAI